MSLKSHTDFRPKITMNIGSFEKHFPASVLLWFKILFHCISRIAIRSNYCYSITMMFLYSHLICDYIGPTSFANNCPLTSGF